MLCAGEGLTMFFEDRGGRQGKGEKFDRKRNSVGKQVFIPLELVTCVSVTCVCCGSNLRFSAREAPDRDRCLYLFAFYIRGKFNRVSSLDSLRVHASPTPVPLFNRFTRMVRFP